MTGEVSGMSTGVQPPLTYPECLEQLKNSWNYGYRYDQMKKEPMDDTRNDSGVTSCSSPTSDRSDPSRSSPENVYSCSINQKYNPWSPADNPQASSSNHPTPEGLSEQLSQKTTDGSSVSPKPVSAADDNSNKFDDEGIRTPKVNSNGKMKVLYCKQCDFNAFTKYEIWEHSVVHINSDKALKCTECPFVTEYKHHLEYHLLNHAGAKPFKCPDCDYSCVNKSMLNSHLKSHSKVYQYRCSDCQYETKYCHSLKLHLRKYRHKPAMVLNPDGSPNPLPIIDVYGTRRGPKLKKVNKTATSAPSVPQQPQMPFIPFMNPLLNKDMFQFPLPLLPLANPEMMMNFQNMLEELARQNLSQSEPQPDEEGALDLTQKSSHISENGETDDEDTMAMALNNVEVVENKPEEPIEESKNNNKYEFVCELCGICFGDEVMFRIHMGYHGYNDPFTCNMCGEQCKNKVNFFLHIAKAAH